MEFVSCEFGQSLQLLQMDEVRPLRGGIFLPDVAAEIAKRYRFQTAPAQVGPNQIIKFEAGMKELDGLVIPIASLEIYIDGVAVNSNNTDDADLAMDDFLGWAAEQYKLREPRNLIPRRYQSRLIVDLGHSMGETFITNFQTLSNIVTKSFGSDQPLEVTQINFGPYPAGEYPYLRTWIFQHRINQPHIPNRYFSAAPLSTSAHFDMLCQLEAAAMKMAI